MNLIGTMLVGPHEVGLEVALQSLYDCGCEAIHVLVDEVDDSSSSLLRKYNCNVFSRKWDWDFGSARNFLQDTVPTDARAQIWLDTDDEIPVDTCHKIETLVRGGIRKIYYLPYVYYNDDGTVQSTLDRARLFPAQNVKWHLRSHEYPSFPDGLSRETRADMPIIHRWQPNDDSRSVRCIEGLKKDLLDYPNDTRVMFYLAQSYRDNGDTNDAIVMYKKYLDTGGWDEERMCACLYLSYMLNATNGDDEEGLAYALQAVDETPDRREAYHRVAEIYYRREDWENAYLWLQKEIEIPFPKNATLHVLHDHYRALPYVWLVVPCDHLGKYDEGLEYSKKVLEFEPDDKNAKSNVKYFNSKLAQNRLLEVYAKNESGEKRERPVAFFYVGFSAERWNSESINATGIGGRETSNIRMAEEFCKLGWDVVLFSDCQGKEDVINGVPNVDYPLFNVMADKYKPDVVFTSIRTTIMDKDFPARWKIMWCHDMGFGSSLEKWPDFLTDKRRDSFDEFFFMSECQMNYLLPVYGIPTDKTYLTRSGIDVDRFGDDSIIRNHKRLIYSSSADRGLERLLDYWTGIKEREPEAELHVYYGFLNALEAARLNSHSKEESEIKWVENIISTMDSLPDVYYHDRIPQDQLAIEFQRSAVWAYPTDFWETMCLSALEAAAAGCAIVTTDLAALSTTVGEYGTLISGDPDSDAYRKEFIDEVVRLLQDNTYWKEKSELAKQNIYGRYNSFGTYYWDWKAIAQEWDRYLRGKLGYDSSAFYQFSDGQAFDYLSARFVDYMQDKQEIVAVMKSIREYLGGALDNILEIGCGFGANLCMLSRLLSSDGVIAGITFQVVQDCYVQEDVIQSLVPTGKYVLINERSQDTIAMNKLAGILGDKKLDVAFIDGDHAYEKAKADWNNVLSFMADKSVVVIHDLVSAEGCRKLFDELKGSYRSEEYIYEGREPGTGVIFLDKQAAQQPKIVELGSGDHPVSDESPVIHTDVREGLDHIECVCDMHSLPFMDNSLDKVTSHHVLEHESWRDTLSILEESWDVLKPGGTIQVAVPDFYLRARQLMDCQKNIYEMSNMIYSWQSYPENYHKVAFTQSSLRSLFARAGFAVTGITVEGDNDIITGKKPEYLDKNDICILGKEKCGIDGSYSVVLNTDRLILGINPWEHDCYITNRVESPELSIIVIGHKQLEERTKLCIAKIREVVKGVNYELIGVDDGSKDGTSEFYQANADITVSLSPRQGICMAYNAGIKVSNAPYICIIQNDIDISDGFIEKMLEAIKLRSTLGLLSGRNVLYHPDSLMDDSKTVTLLPYPFTQDDCNVLNNIIPSPCMLFRREHLANMGMFDPFLYNAWEDHDIMLQAQSIGLDVAILNEPRISLLPNNVNIVGDISIYTPEQRLRRFFGIYYFHLKWNYRVDKDLMFSLGV